MRPRRHPTCEQYPAGSLQLLLAQRPVSQSFPSVSAGHRRFLPGTVHSVSLSSDLQRRIRLPRALPPGGFSALPQFTPGVPETTDSAWHRRPGQTHPHQRRIIPPTPLSLKRTLICIFSGKQRHLEQMLAVEIGWICFCFFTRMLQKCSKLFLDLPNFVAKTTDALKKKI